MEDLKAKQKKGFAAMGSEQQRAIAARGGKRSHELGKGHEFTPGEARAAGRKGGVTVSRDKAHMAAIGRKGGLARATKARDVLPPCAVP